MFSRLSDSYNEDSRGNWWSRARWRSQHEGPEVIIYDKILQIAATEKLIISLQNESLLQKYSLRLFVPTSCFPFFKKYKDLKTVQFLLFVYKISHLNIHLTATGERGARIHMQRGADWWSGIFTLKGFAFRSEYFQSQDIKHNLPLQRRIINACKFSLKTGCDALTHILLKNWWILRIILTIRLKQTKHRAVRSYRGIKKLKYNNKNQSTAQGELK